MKFDGLKRRVWVVLLLAALGAGLVGCATEESANDSPRPWNTPEGWQNGSLPGMMTQPH